MKGIFVALAVAVAVFFPACGNPLGSKDVPDINGTWVAETDFYMEQNTCALPNSSFERSMAEEFVAGGLLNIWQDPTDRSRMCFGILEGTLKSDGTFVTRELKMETVYREFPDGVTKIRVWAEGKFSGHHLDAKIFYRIALPNHPECEASGFFQANRTAGG